MLNGPGARTLCCVICGLEVNVAANKGSTHINCLSAWYDAKRAGVDPVAAQHELRDSCKRAMDLAVEGIKEEKERKRARKGGQ